MHRFYAPNLQKNALDAAESRHFAQVLRGKKGDRITVIDGRGRETLAEVIEISSQTVRFRPILERTSLPLGVRITLAQAIPKKNFDFILEKATELRVSAIVPLISDRTIAGRTADADAKRRRWQQICIEACKQSRNNWLPSVEPPQKVAEFVTKLTKFDMKLIASLQPNAQNLKKVFEAAPQLPRSVVIFIGPEGDFTPAEMTLAKSAGCVAISLGPLVLRAETAAVYALSILNHELQSI